MFSDATAMPSLNSKKRCPAWIFLIAVLKYYLMNCRRLCPRSWCNIRKACTFHKFDHHNWSPKKRFNLLGNYDDLVFLALDLPVLSLPHYTYPSGLFCYQEHWS